MKKIKLIAIALLASSMGLVSCNGKNTPNNPGEQEQQTEEVAKYIESISLYSDSTSILAYSTLEITASVKIGGNSGFIDTSVKWSIDDSSVAALKSATATKVTLTGKKEGDVTVTATSVADETKTATITIHVSNKGLHPELLENGYEFSSSWPTEKINQFTGVQIPTFDAKEGVYYAEFEEDNINKVHTHARIILENTEENHLGLSNSLNDAGYGYFFYDGDYFEYEAFIDPSLTCEIDVGTTVIDEISAAKVISVDFYFVEDLWSSSEDTTDTEWNTQTMLVFNQFKVDLPFVKLGKDYSTIGYKEDNIIEITDNSADYTKLDNYGKVLIDIGYQQEEREDGLVYIKSIDDYKYAVVRFGFTYYGNTIDITFELKELATFPSNEVSTFISSIPSKYSLPSFTWDEKNKFTFQSLEDESGKYISVGVLNIDENKTNAFVQALIQDGFVFDEIKSYQKGGGMSYSLLEKGKISVDLGVFYSIRIATDEEFEYYMNVSEFDIQNMTKLEYDDYYFAMMTYTISGKMIVYDYETIESIEIVIYENVAGMEEPGIYLPGSKLVLNIGNTFTLEPIFFEIEDSLVTYESSNENVVTVDENGVISVAHIGEAVVTVSIEGTDYSDSVTVIVEKTIKDYLPNLNAWIALQGGSETFDSLPEITGALDYSCYENTQDGCFTISSPVDNEYADEDYGWDLYGAGYENYEYENIGKYLYMYFFKEVKVGIYLDKETMTLYLDFFMI